MNMSGKEVAKMLHSKRKQQRRTLVVSHKEGTGLNTVYQPGPFGTAALAGAMHKNKGLLQETGDGEFDDDGVHGYFNFNGKGLFS